MNTHPFHPLPASHDVAELRARLTGEVVTRADESWDEARQAWNLAVDQRPAFVALPETAEDVVAIVEFARDAGLRVAPQGTGHAAAPLGDLEDTILVKTSRLRGVTIDAERRSARAEAGVIWIEVVEEAAEHGLAALAGSSPDVGVVGYTLGGGLSWLARKHGIGANQVTAVELVTATLGDVRGVRFLAEPRDSRLASDPGLTVDTTVEETADGFVTTVTITPDTVVHDLALLVDKIHPDARVDDMLVTLLPGETATFHVTSPVAVDVAALTDRSVLKHAGQLVRS